MTWRSTTYRTVGVRLLKFAALSFQPCRTSSQEHLVIFVVLTAVSCEKEVVQIFMHHFRAFERQPVDKGITWFWKGKNWVVLLQELTGVLHRAVMIGQRSKSGEREADSARTYGLPFLSQTIPVLDSVSLDPATKIRTKFEIHG